MEAWTLYLSVRVFLDASYAPHLIAYHLTQLILITPCSHGSTMTKKFRTQAANDPSLRWDIWDTDLWLECFPVSVQASCWPCNYCGTSTELLAIGRTVNTSTSTDVSTVLPPRLVGATSSLDPITTFHSQTRITELS